MDRIRLNASEWMDFRSGEKKCFLLTNGLGGYCSLTVMGNAARNDQALLMGALKAPTVREHLISNVWETLEVDGEETPLLPTSHPIPDKNSILPLNHPNRLLNFNPLHPVKPYRQTPHLKSFQKPKPLHILRPIHKLL